MWLWFVNTEAIRTAYRASKKIQMYGKVTRLRIPIFALVNRVK